MRSLRSQPHSVMMTSLGGACPRDRAIVAGASGSCSRGGGMLPSERHLRQGQAARPWGTLPLTAFQEETAFNCLGTEASKDLNFSFFAAVKH